MKISTVFTILLTLSTHWVHAADERPKIGLVLSGGGARGAAHIGVIEVLEEYQIPIDFIVGTSMGAVIGGLYASGVPISRIKQDFSNLDWQAIFKNDIQRKNAYFRRKLDDEYFIAKNFIGMSNGQVHLSFGLTNGQRLYEIFNSYILVNEPIPNFDDLTIPFKAVSTDLLTGNKIPLDQGDLAQALLASMAVPGIIAPVHMNGYLLVDGGVSNNLPISIAKSMGADIVIVVNVSTPLLKKNQIYDLTSVLGQISNILTNLNIAESEKLLTEHDILITPILGDIETADFDKFKDAILPGKKAAYLVKDKLVQLSGPHAPYPHQMVPINTVAFNETRIKTDPTFCSATYGYYLHFSSSMMTVNEINEHIDKLYGLNVFDSIYYEIQQNNAEKQIDIKPILKEKSALMFQESLLLESDFHDNSYFSLVLGVTNPHVNRLLGEWRVVGSLGSNVGFFAEFYQPLEPTLSWFIDPYVNFTRNPFNLYWQFAQVAQLMDTTYTTGIQFGKTFSNWGRALLFAEYEYTDLDLIVGPQFVPQGHGNDTSIGASFEWDTLDNLYFPHHGLKGNVTVSTSHDTFGCNRHFAQVASKGLAAVSTGKHSLLFGGKYNTTLSGEPGITSQYFLGGIFQLSGLYNNEVFANNAVLGSAIYLYELSNLYFIPNRPFPVYIGASMEGAKIWGNSNIDNTHSRLFANSLFVGTDTIIGPIYLAAGANYNGHQAVHFLIGPIF